MSDFIDLNVAPYLPPFFQFRCRRLVDLDFPSPEQTLPCLPAPTRQHEVVQAKRGRRVVDLDTSEMTHANCRHPAFVAV